MISSNRLEILGRLTAYYKCLFDKELLGYDSNQRRQEYKGTQTLAKRYTRKIYRKLKKKKKP
jgi:hypothetical protein